MRRYIVIFVPSILKFALSRYLGQFGLLILYLEVQFFNFVDSRLRKTHSLATVISQWSNELRLNFHLSKLYRQTAEHVPILLLFVTEWRIWTILIVRLWHTWSGL